MSLNAEYALINGKIQDIRGATIVVAASNSLNKRTADYVCDGVNDHLEIQAAIDALPATGGEVFLLEGTYYIESSIVLDSYQTLRGCGRNTILTTTTADIDIITATGGDGSEKVGILIADLCVDGNDTITSGISFTYVDYSRIMGIWAKNCSPGWAGITLTTCDFNELIGNIFKDNEWDIYLLTCNNNVISGNNCYGGAYENIFLYESHNNIVTGNTVRGSAVEGICISDGSHRNTVMGNTCAGNGTGASKYSGITIVSSDENVIIGNQCEGNGLHGIYIFRCSHCLVVGNVCNNQVTGDGICIWGTTTNSNYNRVTGNVCYNNGDKGIEIVGGAYANYNAVKDNTLQGNSAPFVDGGTNTIFATYVIPFSDGSDPQDGGYLIDVDTEMARAWLRLPLEVQQVVRMKVYARSGLLEADKMRAEFVIYGGADNEGYQTHNGSVANHPSTSANFAADDVIYWTITEAGVLALLGGDSVEVKVLHEAAGDGDCATNAYLRTVELEYV